MKFFIYLKSLNTAKYFTTAFKLEKRNCFVWCISTKHLNRNRNERKFQGKRNKFLWEWKWEIMCIISCISSTLNSREKKKVTKVLLYSEVIYWITLHNFSELRFISVILLLLFFMFCTSRWGNRFEWAELEICCFAVDE